LLLAGNLRLNWHEPLRQYRPATRLSAEALVKEEQHLHPAERDPSDVVDHATSEIVMGTKLGIDATKKLAGEGYKRPWPPLIRMDEVVRQKIDELFKTR
jgi:3-polyprenyl-4-hydroxybenzoate decarboxylase